MRREDLIVTSPELGRGRAASFADGIKASLMYLGVFMAYGVIIFLVACAVDLILSVVGPGITSVAVDTFGRSLFASIATWASAVVVGVLTAYVLYLLLYAAVIALIGVYHYVRRGL